MAANPNVLLANALHRGYLRLTLRPDRAEADLVAMETVMTPGAGGRVLATYAVEAGRPGPVPR